MSPNSRGKSLNRNSSKGDKGLRSTVKYYNGDTKNFAAETLTGMIQRGEAEMVTDAKGNIRVVRHPFLKRA